MMLIMRFRHMMKGLVGRIFIGLIALLVILSGLGLPALVMRAFGKTINGVALVNGVDIPMHTFQEAVHQHEQRINMFRMQYGPNADLYMKLVGMEQDSKKAALSSVLFQEIVHQFTKQCGVLVADSYVTQKISEPHFITQHFGNQLPAEFLTEDGRINTYAFTQFMMAPEMAQLRELFAEEVASEFAISLLRSALYIPEFITQDLYISSKVDKKFSVQTFNIEHFKHEVERNGVTKEELRNFYERKSNVEKWYWIPEQRSGSVWEFNATTYGVEVEDSEIEDFYTKNKSSRYVKNPAQFKVREIIFNDVKGKGIEGLKQAATKAYEQVIANPDNFAAIAREFSQDKESASKGGLTDFFSRGSKDKAYERAVVRLKADGDISPVVQFEDGQTFVILQRVERKEPTYSSLSEVKSAIAKTLTEQKFKKLFSKNTEKICRDRNAGAIEAFAQQHGGKHKEVGPIEKNNSQEFQRIFSIRNVGDTVAYVQDGKGYLLTLKDKQAKHLPKFSEVEDKVAKDYKAERAFELMQEAIETARIQGFKQHALVEMPGSKIHTTGVITASDENNLKKLITQQAYPERFMNLTRVGDMVSNVTPDQGILVRLDELIGDVNLPEGDQKFKAEGASYRAVHQLFASACIASLFRNATINVNQNLVPEKDLL